MRTVRRADTPKTVTASLSDLLGEDMVHSLIEIWDLHTLGRFVISRRNTPGTL